MTTLKLFARIENSKIVDCPVGEDFINARSDPTDNYIEIISSDEPAFSTLTHRLIISYDYHITHVKSVYTVVPRTIEELLADVSKLATTDAQGAPVVLFSSLSIPLIMAVADAATAKVQRRLDSFAKTRGYDDIGSICTYYNSTYPRFKAEGQYAVSLRDSTWTSLYYYLTSVQTGAMKVPMQWSDIEAVLPVEEWPI